MRFFCKQLFKRMLVSFVVIVCFSVLLVQPIMAYSGYVYSYNGEPQESLAVYLPQKQIRLSDVQHRSINQATDITYDHNGCLYVADTENNQILIYDKQGNLLRSIEKFTLKDGTTDTFSAPSGLCAHNDLLYVADTSKNRIVVLNHENVAVQIIDRPSGTGITDTFVYEPISVAVDESGRIYVVSQSSNMGVLSFTAEGKFEAFIGAQVVTPTALEIFWRIFMTEEQRERSKKQIPVDYCDIEIDEEGFLLAVSTSLDKNLQYNSLVSRSISSDYAPIKRLNMSGSDVLKRTGFFPPAGDITLADNVPKEQSVSAFAGVTATDFGTYSVIDSTNNKIFTYDAEGNLLCAFGGTGSSMGQFSSVTAIASIGSLIAVLDMNASTITVFELSDYGKLIYEAISLTNDREYDLALKKWQEILPLNANLDNVYVDIGNAYLRNGEYKQAMDCFRMVQSKELYSEAFSEYRASYVSWLIVLLPVGTIILAVLFSFVAKIVRKRNHIDDMNPAKKVRFTSELCYGGHTMFHPFDGFYQLQRHKRGGIRGAGVFLLWAIAALLLSRYLSGFLFSQAVTNETNLIYDVFQLLFPLLVFVTANFCVTSLMSGEGTFSNIFTVVCYSLLPICLILPLCTIVANGLSLEESQILNFVIGTSYAWSALLVVFGLQTIHGYSLMRNILSLLLTLLGMVIILFLTLLAIAISQKIFAFFYSLIVECIWRF